MKIAFCTTCKGRMQHLRETLPRNMKENPKSTFVVLDYSSDDGLREFLINIWMADDRLVVYSFYSAGAFKMAHAKNMAHRLAIREGADILVNLDADNFAGPGFEDFIAQQYTAGYRHCFLWADMIKGVLARGISGRIVVTKEAFVKVGGYDEAFETYSPDDKDFNYRLRAIGLAAVVIPPTYLEAIRHNDKMRFREYPHVATDPYSSAIVRHRSAVVNQGRIGCGVVYRNFVPEPITIAPVPTRVFGIGMHKTATTSLHHAFQEIGLDSAHWVSAHWAKAIWREMNMLGYSPTLEQHYAMCDLPFPLLFRQLDRAYPGSKFILTIKDEEQWLEAAAKHFDVRFNKWRRTWDTDPFSHRIHKILYGRTDFDREVFLARYRYHNEAVLDHFKDRPRDLLVMQMDQGAGWQQLCDFLDRPIPTREYPKANPDGRD